MTRPLVGVTAGDKGGRAQVWAIRFCLWLTGARSVVITPSQPRPPEPINGILVSGGTDIFPGLFKSQDIKQDYQYDQPRDELELKYLETAQSTQLPIFCICRGAQLLNTMLGGTLFTNIQLAFEEANYPSSLLAKIFYRKKINIDPDSILMDALQANEAWVNSMHTQSIDQLGSGLKVTSKEDNDIVQCVENIREGYIVGVQFHPEFLIYRKDIRRLFSQFVKQCQLRGQKNENK